MDEGRVAHPATTVSAASPDNNLMERFMRDLLAKSAAIVVVVFSCVACAPEIVRSNIEFTSITDSKELIQLTRTTVIPNYSGTGTSVFVGTRWARVGDVVHGKVYRSRDSVFFLRGANSHEAYLVINDKKLVGFYLPGDRAWSPLTPPLDIDFIVN